MDRSPLDYAYVNGDARMYGAFYRSAPRSECLRAIWLEVYGDDFPADTDPFGFCTRTDLDRILAGLQLRTGDRLVDLGCGRGGPGLWIAQRSGAALIGLDVVPDAVRQAEQFRASFALAAPASFRVGSFERTGLPDRYADAAMSVDSLWMVADKPAALREIARVLRPGGRLALTSWIPVDPDFRQVLSRSAFVVESMEETPQWLERQIAVYQRIRQRRRIIADEIGPEPARLLLSEAEHAPARLAAAPRILVVAARLDEQRPDMQDGR